MRTEEEILAAIRNVEWGTLSGSAEEMTMDSLRRELREWREANPRLGAC